MARLQILQLPAGPNDDRRPFILVIDEYTPQRYILGMDQAEPSDPFVAMAETIGARAVIAFQEAVDIPANEVPVAPDGYPVTIPVAVRVEGDLERFREQVQAESTSASRALIEASEPAPLSDRATQAQIKLKSFAEGRPHLDQQRKNALTDALGMDRLRDWDDIVNAARGLRRERDHQHAAIDAVRSLHRPVESPYRSSPGIICAVCSDYDEGGSTGRAPVAHDECPTIKALDTKPSEGEPECGDG